MTDNIPPSAPDSRRRVLITGAAGRIGRAFTRRFYTVYDMTFYCRPDEAYLGEIAPYGSLITGELGDLECLKVACEGIHTVVHLAANADPGGLWQSILPNNIIGTYNVYAAAKSQGVKRVLFASSIRAVSGYDPMTQIRATDAPNPGDLYGVSKGFGEILGRYMANQENVGGAAVRIGAFMGDEQLKADPPVEMWDTIVSERDLMQLFGRIIEADTAPYAVYHGLSNNRWNRMEIESAKSALNYNPQDDITDMHPTLRALGLDNRVYHGLKDEWQKDKSGLRQDV